jgi:hypothetical protein
MQPHLLHDQSEILTMLSFFIQNPFNRNKPSSDLDKLEQLEKKMADAGDQIIWDALKYTGAHRDETLSPEQLAQVKNNIVQKLSTAYR